MMEIIATPGRVINIGYEGEDNVTAIKFYYDSEWLLHGAGEFKIRIKRPCDTEAYNATRVIDDREAMALTMTVTDIELSVKGYGELQIMYIGSDFVKKSQIYRYNVSRAIDSEIIDPPQGSIIDELVQRVGDLSELTTTDKSSLVSAINEVNTKEGGGSSVTVDDELSGDSENPVQNKVIKVRFDGLDQTVADMQTVLVGKASTDVATQSANGLMSAQDKSKLDGLGNSGVSDVQVNGTSIVSDGVAEIPIAGVNELGLVKKVNPARDGINIGSDGTIAIYGASLGYIKTGTANALPITPSNQHQSTFYGLAKVAGHDEKNSTLPVGTYTEEAKTAIRTMLGLEDMYQWYKNNSGN